MRQSCMRSVRWVVLIVVLAWLIPARQTSGQPVSGTAISGTTCPGAGCVIIPVSGSGSIGIEIAGTFVGTIQFEQSNGGAYRSLSMTPVTGGDAATSTTGIGHWNASVAGVSLVKVRFSAYTSGTATVYPVRTQARLGGSSGGGGATPGGADGDVQVNDSGAFAGFGDWDGTRLLLDGGGIGPGVTAAAWTDFVTNGWIPSFGTLFAGDATHVGYETDSFGSLYRFLVGGTRASPTAATEDQYGQGTLWYASKDGTSTNYTLYAVMETYFNEHEEGNGVGSGGVIIAGHNKAGSTQRSELVLDGAGRTASFLVGGSQMLLVDGVNDVVRLPLLTSNGVVATSGGNGTLGVDATITAGTWTPTLTNVANLDGSTAFQCQYLRIGATVTGSCRFSVDPTAAVTSTQLGAALPVASNFGAVEDAAGSCSAESLAGEVAAIRADTSNDRLELRWQAADVTDHVMTCDFAYQVI